MEDPRPRGASEAEAGDPRKKGETGRRRHLVTRQSRSLPANCCSHKNPEECCRPRELPSARPAESADAPIGTDAGLESPQVFGTCHRWKSSRADLATIRRITGNASAVKQTLAGRSWGRPEGLIALSVWCTPTVLCFLNLLTFKIVENVLRHFCPCKFSEI